MMFGQVCAKSSIRFDMTAVVTGDRSPGSRSPYQEVIGKGISVNRRAYQNELLNQVWMLKSKFDR
jgi:hypothetical protein